MRRLLLLRLRSAGAWCADVVRLVASAVCFFVSRIRFLASCASAFLLSAYPSAYPLGAIASAILRSSLRNVVASSAADPVRRSRRTSAPDIVAPRLVASPLPLLRFVPRRVAKNKSASAEAELVGVVASSRFAPRSPMRCSSSSGIFSARNYFFADAELSVANSAWQSVANYSATKQFIFSFKAYNARVLKPLAAWLAILDAKYAAIDFQNPQGDGREASRAEEEEERTSETEQARRKVQVAVSILTARAIENRMRRAMGGTL